MSGIVRIEVCTDPEPEIARALADRLSEKHQSDGFTVVICKSRVWSVIATVKALEGSDPTNPEPVVTDGDPVSNEGTWIVVATKA